MVDYKQLTRRVNMAAVIMVDSGSQGRMVPMTHDSKYRLQRKFILSYLLIALLNSTENGILAFYS